MFNRDIFKQMRELGFSFFSVLFMALFSGVLFATTNKLSPCNLILARIEGGVVEAEAVLRQLVSLPKAPIEEVVQTAKRLAHQEGISYPLRNSDLSLYPGQQQKFRSAELLSFLRRIGQLLDEEEEILANGYDLTLKNYAAKSVLLEGNLSDLENIRLFVELMGFQGGGGGKYFRKIYRFRQIPLFW